MYLFIWILNERSLYALITWKFLTRAIRLVAFLITKRSLLMHRNGLCSITCARTRVTRMTIGWSLQILNHVVDRVACCFVIGQFIDSERALRFEGFWDLFWQDSISKLINDKLYVTDFCSINCFYNFINNL